MEYLIVGIVSMIIAGIITGSIQFFIILLGITDADITINRVLLFIFAYITADCMMDFYKRNRKEL